MATYFTSDFADFTTCSGGVCGDWTERIKLTGWTPAGDVVGALSGSNDWRILSWNDVEDGNHANIEVLAVINFAVIGMIVLTLRTSGGDEATTNYSVGLNATALRTYYCAGADTPAQIQSVAATHSASTDIWVRFRVNGASPTTIQAKTWTGALGDEPGSWACDATDSSGPQVAGWNGLSSFSLSASPPTYKQIGFGTNGDTAPAAAASGVPTLSLPTYVPNSRTSVGFRPRVTAT